MRRPAGESRPEFYDFDLFHQPGQTPEQDNRPLTALSYTVFDTETTGLQPSQGDEIVSIGAVRIVQRPPARAGGVRAARRSAARHVAGGEQDHRHRGLDARRPADDRPRAARVSRRSAKTRCWSRTTPPSTCASCASRRRRPGVRFTQPVLDTLLLSAVIHPQQESHGLEAIAERMGINPIGRHTALGDAIMTGEIFLRMIPLLAQQGIRTLGEAREASAEDLPCTFEY